MAYSRMNIELEQKEEQKKCEECGTRLWGYDEKFCPYCGWGTYEDKNDDDKD